MSHKQIQLSDRASTRAQSSMALTSIDGVVCTPRQRPRTPQRGLISGTQIVPPGGASHERGTQVSADMKKCPLADMKVPVRGQ